MLYHLSAYVLGGNWLAIQNPKSQISSYPLKKNALLTVSAPLCVDMIITLRGAGTLRQIRVGSDGIVCTKILLTEIQVFLFLDFGFQVLDRFFSATRKIISRTTFAATAPEGPPQPGMGQYSTTSPATMLRWRSPRSDSCS